MRYFYEKPEKYAVTAASVYSCNHPLYNKCTLYKFGNRGLAVVQKRYNAKLKLFWWGPIDPWLIDEIFNNNRFMMIFDQYSGVCMDDLYPTIEVRKLMWALRMKPMVKEFWEEDPSR